MQVQRHEVLVRRDMAEVIPMIVGEHEIDVLRDVYGDAAISTGPAVGEPEEVDAAEEFDRLGMYYGIHASSGVPHVERVYGSVRGATNMEAQFSGKKRRKKQEDMTSEEME